MSPNAMGAGLPALKLAPPSRGQAELRQPGPPAATVVPIGTRGDMTTVSDLIDVKVAVHRNDPLPHPVYDDLPSLTLLFENGLV